MAAELVWGRVREEAVERFGSSPSREGEARLVEAFLAAPKRVCQAIEHVGAAFQAGRVRSPWGVVLAEVARASEGDEVVAEDTAERGKKVSQARQWLRAAGLHFDRWEEVGDELFGDLGRLRSFASDASLRAELEELWGEVRPGGVLVEEQALERAGRWREWRRATRERPGPAPLPIAELLRGVKASGNGASE